MRTLVISAILAGTSTVAHAQIERWALTPDLRIGSLDEAEYALSRVGQIGIGQDGVMYVLEPDDGLVRVFDSNGRFLRSIGGKGEGPGEFRAPQQLGWVGDTLWVTDDRLGRISLFSSHGKLISTITFSSARELPSVPAVPRALLSNGSVIAVGRVEAANVARTGTSSTIPILRLGRNGQVLGTLGRYSLAHQSLILRSDRGVQVLTFQPFRDNLLWRVEPSGRSVVLVDRPAASRGGDAYFRVTKLNTNGDTLFSKRYRYKPQPVSRRLADSLIAVAIRRADIFTTRSAAERAVRHAIYLPQFHPPVTDLVVGQDGTVWLRREDFGSGRISWNVLDERGRVTATLAVPSNLHIQQAERRRVWAVEHDDVGVPYIVRYRVQRIAR
jgi:hypothetical protein